LGRDCYIGGNVAGSSEVRSTGLASGTPAAKNDHCQNFQKSVFDAFDTDVHFCSVPGLVLY